MNRNADLYLQRIDWARYSSGESCELCRVSRLEELLEKIRSGELPRGPCAHWPASKVAAFRLAADARTFLPQVPMLEFPRPVEPGYWPVNDPKPDAPALVTGNSEFTQAILLAVISRTLSPLHLLFVDALGHTVDMAMIFQTLTPKKIAAGLTQAGIGPKARMILPGLCASLQPELESLLGRAVEVGPICAAELPLYLGNAWQMVESATDKSKI